MSSSIFTSLFTFCYLLSLSYASIPSMGLETVISARASLNASDFKIVPAKGVLFRTDAFVARIANLAKFPALAGADVQTQIVHVTVKRRKRFPNHYHPRGTEYLYMLSGVIRVTMKTEGRMPQTFVNVLSRNEATVFPQGLIHTIECISKSYCNYASTFNTANPGLVLL